MSRLSKSFALAAATTAAGLAFAAVPAAADEELSEGEQKLEKILEGRVAGEPQRCIRDFPSSRMQVIDDTAIVYGRGKTVYVQRTRNPEDIDRDDVLVVRKFGTTQLCRLDIVNKVDRLSGMFSGSIFFEDFVPYTRAEKAEENET